MGKQLKTRILRPVEYKVLEIAIPKSQYRTMFNALLYSGMRYIEMQRFQDHPEWFDNDFIHLPDFLATRKAKRKQPERWVRLNQIGKMAIRHFLEIDKRLPAHKDWRENLWRWAKYANINPIGLGPKTTRKTYESWLVFYYEDNTTLIKILQSQGHDGVTAIKHYLNFPFTEIEKLEMRPFVEGWV